ncbi:hypothetical protein EUA06_00255 [Nocardioides glacieisoli]|uniref:Uncharacterized protein n=1 Tax=Nocardioides glacieisoli TaxID=1168730 RepID=A0A4Q2S6H6_9ACTN|nr:hypothetical protein [Nocardioides glacieisoli]RYB96065.1 hypothetical protein EUA06_00255 [Nocardioides glacieisoli]
MTPRSGLRLLAVVLPLALLVPAAAHAEKVVTKDAVGDVLVFEGESFEDALPAPEQTNIDVVRTAVSHGDSRLRVRVQFRALEPQAYQFTIIEIATSDAKYEISVERLGGKPVASLSRRRGDVECRSLKAQVDTSAGVLTTSLPTSCLVSPRWVRVGVGAVALDDDEAVQPDGGTVYADDAHRAGEIRERIASGPKVRRG